MAGGGAHAVSAADAMESRSAVVHVVKASSKGPRKTVDIVDLVDQPASVSLRDALTIIESKEQDSSSVDPGATKRPSASSAFERAASELKGSKPKVSKPRAPRAPSTVKIEREFDKFPLLVRQELLLKWSSQLSAPPTALPSDSTETCTAPRSSDEVELSKLRVQLTDASNKMLELAAKEKRLKLAIRKLQRRVATANCMGVAAPEPVQRVLDRLFPTGRPSMGAGLCVTDLYLRAPLWVLSHQDSQHFAALCATRVLMEDQYESLDRALAHPDRQPILLEDSPPAAPITTFAEGEAVVIFEEEKAADDALESNCAVGVSKAHSVLSQLLIELAPRARVPRTEPVDVSEVLELGACSPVGEMLRRQLANPKAETRLSASWEPTLRNVLASAQWDLGSRFVAACLCWAWLASSDCQITDLSASSGLCDVPATQTSAICATPPTRSASDEDRDRKRPAYAEGEGPSELFSQQDAGTLNKKARGGCAQEGPICLITPTTGPPTPSFSGVVDLCCDIYDLPMEPSSSQPAQPSLLQSMRSMEAHALAAARAANSLPAPSDRTRIAVPLSQPPPKDDLPDDPNEPRWEAMPAEELHAMARQYGLNPEDRKLVRLLKAMWKRMNKASAPAAATSTGLTLQELRQCLMQSKTLYENILLFIPVEVDDVYSLVRANGHKISKVQLLSMLDSLAVFASSGGKKDKPSEALTGAP